MLLIKNRLKDLLLYLNIIYSLLDMFTNSLNTITTESIKVTSFVFEAITGLAFETIVVFVFGTIQVSSL